MGFEQVLTFSFRRQTDWETKNESVWVNNVRDYLNLFMVSVFGLFAFPLLIFSFVKDIFDGGRYEII